ncbi:MAG: anthranilate phosphoribosyltransferase [Alphaproteobacteria bacterium]|nr:anthranilate phosphoribosyltransferase [Alphaproteobacteria bacterium]
MAKTFQELLGKVASGATLSAAEAERAFDIMMSGDATASQMGGLLLALRTRGETVEEITGAAATMRAKATTIRAPEGAMDVVGTGGDKSGTYNISTCTAIVVAGCGVPVAKHGNRAATSKSGAADVLSALGIDLDADFPLLEKAVTEAGICFMMAQRHHGAMRNVMPTRIELGTPTIFNILGPLSNPAGVKRLLVGTYLPKWVEPMATTLGKLGAERAWVMHGSDGLDELTITGPSMVCEYYQGKVTQFELSPEDAGLPVGKAEDLKGGDAEYNAAAIRSVLAGEKSAYRDIVLFGTAAALKVAGRIEDLRDGVAMASEAIASGAASTALDRMVAITNEGSP